MDSPTNTITRIRHQSVIIYLEVMRAKAAKFGREALISYSEPQALVLGFRCEDEVHLIGLNNIRAHYNIGRILPDIPGLVRFSRNTASTVSQEVGVKMFMDDCEKALKNE